MNLGWQSRTRVVFRWVLPVSMLNWMPVTLAATLGTNATATVVSPALVDADAAAQLLLGNSIGSLALRIPGGGGGGADGDGSGAGGGGASGTGPGLTQLAELLDNGDGTLKGGVGASLSLREGVDTEVVATVAYN